MSAGRVVVVTGAAGGIGSVVARRFLADGDRVVAVDREAPDDDALPAHASLTTLIADLSDEAACGRIAAAIQGTFGRVDVLVACAGWYPLQPFDTITADEFRRVLDVNLTGPFLVIKALWPLLKGRGWGRVIVVGSASIFEGVPQQVHYVAAKAGLVGMIRSLAKPLGKEGVTISLVAPGLTSTAPVERTMDTDTIAQAVARRAIAREERAEDLVGPIAFLASRDADFMTAQTLIVDGGSHPL